MVEPKVVPIDYEALLAGAIEKLTVDTGLVSSPVNAGGNTLSNSSRNWANNIHKNRLLKIIKGTGVGQSAVIAGNSSTTLLIRGSWPQAIGIGATYTILGSDLAQILRDVFGSGVDIDIAAKIDDVISAIAIGLEASVDTGVATGGSNTTLEDTNKNWAPGMWENSVVQVEIGGISYLRFTATPFNTATVVTINALPVGIVVTAGCPYSIKRALNPLLPLEQALIHNAAVVAAADILAAVLAPTNTPCRFAVEVAFDVAGIFSVRVTNGGVTVGEDFNHGVNLAVNSLFRFSHLVHAGDTINYRYSVNATMLSMRVQEIVAAT